MARFTRIAPLHSLVEQAGRSILDALYPLECVGCGGTGRVICDRCAADLPVLRPPFCRVCSAPGDFARCQACAESVREFDGIRAPFRYAGTIRQAILALKYGGIKAAAPQLGDLLANFVEANPLPGEIVAPVPMHAGRQRERGYNQAELLARRVARHCNLQYEEKLLFRTRQVQPQAGIGSAAERAVNVAGSIGVSASEQVAGAGVILVDDVATTGSTLETCAAALKQAGAASVWGLTLAVVGGEELSE
ncbi:MAG: ComF family protein [Chloroflexi bacterium]|nr:ComF family protein [Chloroflexota bacterium]MYD49681.1 ComF family protein [Chloroflexota bacterium]